MRSAPDRVGVEGDSVAIVRVELFPRSQEQREAIIRGITEVLVANGAKAEGTQVLLYELPPTRWGKGGASFAERLGLERWTPEMAQGADPDEAT